MLRGATERVAPQPGSPEREEFFGTMSARTDRKSMPLLAVFVLTALATIVAQRLPQDRKFVPLALLLDVVPLCGTVAATAFAGRSFRRVPLSLARSLVAMYGYFAGGLVGAFGVAHTFAVVMVAVERARRHDFEYTFRFYSLVLFGVLLIVAGLMAALRAEELARGQRAGWRASLSIWTAILAINLPLVSLQGFAILFSVLAALELLILAALSIKSQGESAERYHPPR